VSLSITSGIGDGALEQFIEIFHRFVKEGTWIKFAIFISSGLYYYFSISHKIPGTQDWEIRLSFVLSSTFGLLWFVGVCSDIRRFFTNDSIFKSYFQRRKEVSDLMKYIPYMNDTEKKIISYLIHNNIKTFECAIDGGHATTLISRRIIRCALLKGQPYHELDVPMFVPDHLWDCLKEQEIHFPKALNKPDGPHPWRVHWMAR
jgi:hypothetical protein